MIFFKEPQADLLVAVNNAFNSIQIPKFSDVRIENGEITLKVEFVSKEYPTQAIIEHLNDAQARILGNATCFPYKFEGFDTSLRFKSFRITAEELECWRDAAVRSAKQSFCARMDEGNHCFTGATVVNCDLVQTLTNACKAVLYYQDNHKEELFEARLAPRREMKPGWRFEAA